MRIFKDLELVEQLGSGMNRIMRVYDKSIFKISEHFFEVCFKFEKSFYNDDNSIGGQIGGQIGGSISLTDRQKDIIGLIKQNPKISRKDIAKILDINQSAVLKHIEKLKSLGRLKRVGGTRGYWKINIEAKDG